MSSFIAKTDVDVVITHTDNRAWNLADYFTVLDPYIGKVMKDYSPAALAAVSSSHSSDKDIKLIPLTTQGLGIYYNKKNPRRRRNQDRRGPCFMEGFPRGMRGDEEGPE